MGCFLGCFRIKDDGSRRCHLFSNSYPWKKRELVVDMNRCSSVVSYEGTPYVKAEQEIVEEFFDGNDSVDEKLRQEAKFLKTCGAILETPVEIRKASDQQSIASDPCCKKINWDQQLGKNDEFPTKAYEFLTFEEEKQSCKIEEDDDTKKMVRFEELKHSVCEKRSDAPALEISPQMEIQMQSNGSDSPYPTPLNLVDGMQTPGTIYLQKLENFRTGRIKAQFVYPVSVISQRSFELNAVCEDMDNTQKAPPTPLVWLKPPSAMDEIENTMDFKEDPSHSDSIPDMVDSSIVGTAATLSSPKQWSGNGIPNSTTKYKEDQKVSWHATPFEVRLEKALSDEKVYPQRKFDGKLVELEDEGRE